MEMQVKVVSLIQVIIYLTIYQLLIKILYTLFFNLKMIAFTTFFQQKKIQIFLNFQNSSFCLNYKVPVFF